RQQPDVVQRIDLYQKIARSHLNGARPEQATPWFEGELALCQKADTSLLPYVMRHLSHQRWLESRTPEALELLENARNCAKQFLPQRSTFYQRADTLSAQYLVLMGRSIEAAAFFAPGKYPRPSRSEKTISRANYLNQQAVFFAVRGRAEEAFREFDKAVRDASRFADGYHLVAFQDDYATWAMALGRLDIARSRLEQALFIARERRIGWRIPYFTLRMADILIKSGDYARAR